MANETKIELPKDDCVCKTCNQAVWYQEADASKPASYCKEIFTVTYPKTVMQACQGWQAKSTA